MLGPFLAYMDRSGREKEPLLVYLNFSVTSSILGGYFNVLKHLIPKHLGDSLNLQRGFTNVGANL